MKRICLTIIAILFLLAGGLIYLCYRSPSILLFRFLDILKFDYSTFQNVNIAIPSFFIYNFSNALFVMFGFFIVYAIWDDDKFHVFLYTLIITVLSIIYEVITKDISDIITISISYIICLLLYIKTHKVKYAK